MTGVVGVRDVVAHQLEGFALARLAGPEGAALEAEGTQAGLHLQRRLAGGADRDGDRAGQLGLLREVLLEDARPLDAAQRAGCT